ncbi:putative nuclease HARBI1 like protein [Danaus plexippus plexippus]|uniref:Nuclease HARBI1 like protein n=1 Tax=Danaus plexippus plexippus TaxID=278856 RepID=A0A212FI90_DANPL|nr:putative nuclease HARBI1 like protein [Danaus plexippus plexippus]
MADKPPEDSYISVVDEEPVFFELLKWDSSQSQKQQEPRSLEKAKSPEKMVTKSKEESDPFDLSDAAFLDMYRLSKDLARNLCEELKPVMPDSIKSIEFSVESKVLAALSFYATGKYQKSIGGRSDPSITQYFVATAVMQVTEAMNDPSIIKKYIHFPHLRNEREVIKNGFYMKYGIPNVVGCVDCVHVPIARPDEDQKKHFNKSYHSKKVQIISDSRQRIMSVCSEGGGSYSHDALLARHAVTVDLVSLNNSRDLCWLLGGPHYSQKPYLMAPVPKMTKKSSMSPEKYYTNLHAQAHSAVTETIKQLKARWKCLQATSNKQFDPPTVAKMVLACCVLHNICTEHGIPPVDMTQAEERLEAMKQRVANAPASRRQEHDQLGLQARAALIQRLWAERSITTDACPATKRRLAKKDRPPETHPVHHPEVHQHQMHDDPKRPRILMNNPYSIGVGMPPAWGHYPQH